LSKLRNFGGGGGGLNTPTAPLGTPLLIDLVNAGEVEDSNLDPHRLIVSVFFFSVCRKMSGLYYTMEHGHLSSLSPQFIIVSLGAK